MTLFKATTKATTTDATPGTKDATFDAFGSLRAQFPLLSGLTKETFPNYVALMIAVVRAEESQRQDAQLHDAFAHALAGDEGRAIAAYFPTIARGREGKAHGILRHRVMDDEIELGGLHPSIAQVVLLGPGMDSRCYRLSRLSNCHAFEVDSSEILMDHKRRVLQQLGVKPLTKALDTIVTDLAAYEWPELLVQRGFDPKMPTLWILEGLLMHLDEHGVDRLLTTIDSLSAPHSHLLGDMVGTGAIQIDFTVDDATRDVTCSMDMTSKVHQGGILRALPWDQHALLQRDAQAQYSGTRWDPKAFARLQVPPEEATFGPLLVASCVKPGPP